MKKKNSQGEGWGRFLMGVGAVGGSLFGDGAVRFFFSTFPFLCSALLCAAMVLCYVMPCYFIRPCLFSCLCYVSVMLAFALLCPSYTHSCSILYYSIYLSIYVSIYLSMYQSIYLCINLSICLSS